MGTWRYAVHSGKCATLNPNGAFAEKNSIKNSLGQQVQPPADMLSAIAKSQVPVRAFSGAYDSTIKPEWAKETQAKMESLGDANSQLTILNTDHYGLTTQPFTPQLLNWMLSITKSGGTPSNDDSNDSNDDSSSSPSTTSSSASSAPTKATDNGSNNAESSSTAPASTSTGTKKTCKRRKRSVKRDTSSPANASDLMRSLLARREAEGLGKRHVLDVQKRGSRLRH